MGLGYTAFGSQKWIAELRPKGFFQKRKTPAGEHDGRQPGDLDYKDAMSLFKVDYDGKPQNFPTYKSPFPVTAFILCMMALALSFWLATLIF